MTKQKWLTRINHITYACLPETVDKWVHFHTEIEGGEIMKCVEDVYPTKTHSSMKLWCINFGSFVLDLVVGIDREEKSHITEFVELHGDHCVQHVAFETPDLEQYVEHLHSHGVQTLGDTHAVKVEKNALVRHTFTQGYSGDGVKNMPFAEYLQINPLNIDDELRSELSRVHADNIKEDLYTHITDSIKSGSKSTLLEAKV